MSIDQVRLEPPHDISQPGDAAGGAELPQAFRRHLDPLGDAAEVDQTPLRPHMAGNGNLAAVGDAVFGPASQMIHIEGPHEEHAHGSYDGRIALRLPSPADLDSGAPAAGVDLDIHGFRAGLHGWPEVIEQVGLDFAWFLEPKPAAPPEINVFAENTEPDFGRFGPVRASFVTPRNVVHQHGRLTIIDYFGRVLTVAVMRYGQ